MRSYKLSLVIAFSCMMATTALAVSPSQLPGYSRMTVSDAFVKHLEADRSLAKTLQDDAELSRLVMTRAVLQKQLMDKNVTIDDIRNTYFPNRNVDATQTVERQNSEAANIIDKAIAATKSTSAQQHSQQQIAALAQLNDAKMRRQAQDMAAAEMEAAAQEQIEQTAPAAVTTTATTANTRDYNAIFAKLKEFTGRTANILLEAAPTGDAKRDSYIPGINMMNSGDDLKRVRWPTFFALMDKLMAPKAAATIDGKQLLALVKAAQNTPEDAYALLANPQINKRLAELKVNPATFVPAIEQPQAQARITHDYEESDSRGFPVILHVPEVCTVPTVNMHIPQNPSSRAAIYSTYSLDPAAHEVIAIPLGSANGYAMQQMRALWPSFNSGLTHEISYSYCPGDFAGVTPPDVKPLGNACITLPSRTHNEHPVPASEQHCLVAQYPDYFTVARARFMNIRTRDAALPPYVGPCLSEGPYPANYNEHTCGLSQVAANGQCNMAKETYSCYDSQNQLPPQTFARTCNNGKWTWTQGYMTPASSRFRCEAVFTKADGTEISYATAQFDSTQIGVNGNAQHPGDTVCAGHREGQIRETICGYGRHENNGFADDQVDFSYVQQCQFNNDTKAYGWATTRLSSIRTENNAHSRTCHTRIVEQAPAGCSISGRFSVIDNLPPAAPSYKAGAANTYRTAAENEVYPVGTRITLRHETNGQGGTATGIDVAVYECKDSGTALQSEQKMLPAFQLVKGKREIFAGSTSIPAGYFLNTYIERP